jgi:hypothetical protein
MRSAFGVEDPRLISKAKKQTVTTPPSAGRVATAALVPFGIHGAVAGKPGHKGRAWGNEFGGSILGEIAGSALTRHPVGTQLGSMGGSAGGMWHAQRRGHLKRES